MKKIKLTQGKLALVDDEDYEYLNQWKWCAAQINGTWYAMMKEKKTNKTIFMHRKIIKTTKLIDHKNSNGLDNTRNNLRECTHKENSYNSKFRKNNTSGYKGVFWHKQGQKWQASIRANGITIYLGLYANADDAAKAYDVAAHKYHGDYAKTNF